LFGTRSFCPHCKRVIAWYDLIPVFSWFFLLGKCRSCKEPISFLYPFIELLTVIIFLTFWFIIPHYHIAYFFLFSALLVTIRTDLETMLISRYVTVFLIPLGMFFAAFGFLPITLLSSIFGAVLGYGSLWAASKLFYLLTGKEGIGQGDLELLAFIGSFIGAAGCWVSLFLGAIIGSVFGLIYITCSGKSKEVRIPFGPFLAFGAILYVLFQNQLLFFLFGL